MRLIWATRGRTWGFRFLLNGGFDDPLVVRDDVFSGFDDQPEAWRRVDGKVALRFPDPLGRQDAAGRVIPHEFVVLEPEADRIDSLEEGRREIWPLVAAEFERVWQLPEPPSTPRSLPPHELAT